MDRFQLPGIYYNYLIYGIFAILVLLSILFASVASLISACAAFLVSIIYSKSANIINPMLSRKAKVCIVSGSYALSHNPRVAVLHSENIYTCVGASLLKLNSQVTGASEKFNEIVAKCKYPFEFSVIVEEMSTKKVTEELETRRRIKEIELSRLDGTKIGHTNKLQRELEVINGEIAEISHGSKPVHVKIRIKCSASSYSESEAANTMLSRLDSVSNLFGATYNLSHRFLSGEELMKNISG
ncbi:MAG: hypothetical protein KGH61_01415 [Candidatus Micrarchaeota archaeon]|nr:hypothetical protein [Candidatus Micrarchaeota archaeon]MDE1847589.1 hypothetical protein [Candidatus Micrarchaeota archaeon]MDE1864821.1 hypothetical protein [Candidatus Micrarchaeota archaeon]